MACGHGATKLNLDSGATLSTINCRKKKHIVGCPFTKLQPLSTAFWCAPCSHPNLCTTQIFATTLGFTPHGAIGAWILHLSSFSYYKTFTKSCYNTFHKLMDIVTKCTIPKLGGVCAWV